MKYLLALLCFISFSSIADDTPSIYLGGNSYHFAFAEATNSRHHFVALEYKGYIAGKYLNSYGYDTEFVAKKFPLDGFGAGGNLAVNALVGISHGYRFCMYGKESEDALYCPALALEFQYTKYRIRPSVLVIAGGAVLVWNVKF